MLCFLWSTILATAWLLVLPSVCAHKCIDTSVWKLLCTCEVEFIQNLMFEFIWHSTVAHLFEREHAETAFMLWQVCTPCAKKLFSYSRNYSMIQALLELNMSSFDTLYSVI